MEILVVVGTLTGLGGIEVCVRALARDAAAHGDTVRVLAMCPSVDDEGWHEGLIYSEVGHGSRSLKKQVVQGLPAFVRACREHPPDAVIVIYSATLLMARLGLRLAGLRRPVLAWLHFSLVLKQRTSLLRLADGHLCISAEIAQATKKLPGVRPDDVYLVYNGTPMEAIRIVPRSRGGPLRVLHVGHGRQAVPWDAVQAADVLVVCSAPEGFPLVLIEAMVRGIPCVSSDCPSGPSDVVRPGENGWLFKVGDVAGLGERLQSLVSGREALPSVDAVRASVREFSSSKVFHRIRRGIEETVAGRCSRSTTSMRSP